MTVDDSLLPSLQFLANLSPNSCCTSPFLYISRHLIFVVTSSICMLSLKRRTTLPLCSGWDPLIGPVFSSYCWRVGVSSSSPFVSLFLRLDFVFCTYLPVVYVLSISCSCSLLCFKSGLYVVSPDFFSLLLFPSFCYALSKRYVYLNVCQMFPNPVLIVVCSALLKIKFSFADHVITLIIFAITICRFYITICRICGVAYVSSSSPRSPCWSSSAGCSPSLLSLVSSGVLFFLFLFSI